MKRIVALALFLAMAAPAIAAPDEPSAFAEWFVAQGFEGQEYYKWQAIFSALIDGRDRSREAHMPISTPVFVAITSGTKYHVKESCSALKNASTVLELDLVEATERGFEKCGRCAFN